MSALSVLKADPFVTSQLMGNLPRDKVVPDYPFNCSAIHIEIVSDLTSDAFIATLKDFLVAENGSLYCRTHKSRYQVPIAELAERWTELPQVSDESRSFFRVHTGYFSNIPKCIKAEFIASWACSQSSVVSSSQR
ncbi:hypothetical protein TNCV_4456781 [Trichonephila clavipes]|nr:hypothetical protein TNCV_4456781 [Trichonephila clavipes]